MNNNRIAKQNIKRLEMALILRYYSVGCNLCDEVHNVFKEHTDVPIQDRWDVWIRFCRNIVMYQPDALCYIPKQLFYTCNLP